MDNDFNLAGVALEVAQHYPDTNMDIPRAEWRYMVISLAEKIIKDKHITSSTEDVDEVVTSYISQMESLS